MNLHSLFSAPPAGFQAIEGQYSTSLVALSIAVAFVAATLTLHCLKAARDDTSLKLKFVPVIVGTLALSGGTWSMHFIGMQALEYF